MIVSLRLSVYSQGLPCVGINPKFAKKKKKKKKDPDLGQGINKNPFKLKTVWGHFQP